MTLISNEIYLLDTLKNSFIVSSADRRLTYRTVKNPKEKYVSGKKLFKIDYLNSTVSFWGATQLTNEKNKIELLSDWLPKFITSQHSQKTLLDFANDLRGELNKRMYKPFLKLEPSGFHFSGIRPDGVPEFIHFSNCGLNSATGYYENIISEYREPFQDFLNRDALEYGWDGINPNSFQPANSIRLYRNGDIKAHAAAWDKLDQVFHIVFSYPDFKKPYASSDADILKLTRQKLTFISSIYNSWANTKIVGAPWDIIILRNKK